MKRILTVFFCAFLIFPVLWLQIGFAADATTVMSRWSRTEHYSDKDLQGFLDLKITYYSAEYVEALVQSEAQKNLWTQDEMERYKYQLLKTLKLNECIVFHFEFDNAGSTMHMAPFDSFLTLWVGKKKLSPVDYDKRFNFALGGKRDGMVWFPRYDEKTDKPLLEKVLTVKLDILGGISPITTNRQFLSFIWDVSKDNPQRLYQGKAASRLELDRLIARIKKLTDEKAELEGKIAGIDKELLTVQQRVDELQKQ